MNGIYHKTILTKYDLQRELFKLTKQEITYMIDNYKEKLYKEEENKLIKPLKYNGCPDINKIKELINNYNDKYYGYFENSNEYVEKHSLNNEQEKKELLDMLERELYYAVLSKVETPEQILEYLLRPIKGDRFDLNEFKDILLTLKKRYDDTGNIKTIIGFVDKYWDALNNLGDC